jgi:hypothetical protein
MTFCPRTISPTVVSLSAGPSLPLRRKTIQKKRAKDAKKKSTIRRKLAREAPVQQSGSKAGADVSPPVARPRSQEQMPSTMAEDTAPNLTPKSALTPLQQQRSLASVLERLRRKTVTSGSPRSGSACRSSMVGKESTTSRWAIHEGNQ